MFRSAPLALGALVLVAGCPDEPAVDAAGSSSDASSGSSGDPASTGASLDDTAGTSTAADGSGTDGSGTDGSTTGGVPLEGRARLLVRQPIDARGPDELVLYAYADGELAPPQPLTPEPAGGGGITASRVAPSGEAATYCVTAPPQSGSDCFAIDLTTHPPGRPQPFNVGPVPSPASMILPSRVEATGTYVFRAADPMDPADAAIYSAMLADGALGAPQVVAVAAPGAELGLEPVAAPDGSVVAYGAGPAEGPVDLFLAPLAAPDPDAAVNLSNLADPALRVYAPTFLPGRQAVLYFVDDDPIPGFESLHLVDLSGPSPAVPLRVDDPLDAPLDVRTLVVAPDGHALLYHLGTSGIGDVMLVDLLGGMPASPVRVSTLGEGQARYGSIGWSPDSRWITYLASGADPNTFELYLVDHDGGVLGMPVHVAGGIARGSQTVTVLFDAASQWLYYVAPHDAEAAELYRVDVSGAEPGPPQRVNAPLSRNGWLSREIVVSHDGRMLLYTATDGAPPLQAMWLVDVSGLEPSEPLRIGAPLVSGWTFGFGTQFSWDDSVVVYDERGPGNDDPRPLRLVDLSAPDIVLTVTEDVTVAYPIPE